MLSKIFAFLAIIASFGAAYLIVIAIGKILAKQGVMKRLQTTIGTYRAFSGTVNTPKINTRWSKLLLSLSNLSLPEEGWQGSELHLKFLRAGFRGDVTPKIYFAAKSILSIVVPLILAIVLGTSASEKLSTINIALYVVLAAGVGYYAPDLYIRIRTNSRAKKMQDNLPDLIDLLVICTESGLGMDAAMNRVSKEITRTCHILAEEFYLTSLEIRAGAGRSVALRNLALRVNVDDLSNLVSMLIQADKFGTSLAESLRIQSEVMRVRRLQRAEEIASKIPVKMLLPLILFIFPCMLIVLLGPAMIQVSEAFGK